MTKIMDELIDDEKVTTAPSRPSDIPITLHYDDLRSEYSMQSGLTQMKFLVAISLLLFRLGHARTITAIYAS